MPKHLSPLDLAQNELRNAKIQNLAADPGSPVVGQAYFNTGTGKMRVYNGSTWDEMGTSTAAGDVTSNTATSVDGEIVLFNGATGKQVKRGNAFTGLLKLAAGVASAAVAGTDYLTGASTNALTNKSIDANGTGNSITNLEVADFAANVVDNDSALGAASSTRIPTQSAVKSYVDNSVQGLSWKASVRAASTANVTIASALINGSAIDGVTLATGDRVLLKNQTAASQNGIYVVVVSGAAARSTDMNTAAEALQATVYVQEGTTQADTVWTNTVNAPITLDTTNLAFAQVNGGSVPTATTSTEGKTTLATTAETNAKSVSTKAVTPASLTDFTRKYSATIGDASATAIAVTHSLGSQDVIVQLRQVSDNAIVEADIVNTSTTVSTITFSTAPATNSIRVVVIG